MNNLSINLKHERKVDYHNPHRNIEDNEDVIIQTTNFDPTTEYWKLNDPVADAREKQLKIDVVRLKQCEVEAQMSNCVKHSVGCIITNIDGRVVSTGYNGTPAGHENCCDKFPHFKESMRNIEAYEESSQHYASVKMTEDIMIREHREWSMTHEIHAEVNAIMHSTASDIRGGTLYVNLQPCPNCAKMIAGAGVARVVYAKAYHRANDDVSKKIFEASNIEYLYIPEALN